MALDQRQKRQNIAGEAVDQATILYDAIRNLSLLSDEAAQAGTFVDADFDGTNLTHLTPAMVTTLLGSITTSARTWAETAAQKTVFMQVRR